MVFRDGLETSIPYNDSNNLHLVYLDLACKKTTRDTKWLEEVS